MAYVPPHRRMREGSASSLRPTPVAPPPQQGDRIREGSSSSFRPTPVAPTPQQWHLSGYVRNNFRKWFAVDDDGDTSNLLLNFKPFHGETYEHLRDKKHYTLFANRAVNEGFEVENNLRSSAINEGFPWKKICERFKDNILEKFRDMQSYIEESKPDHVKPTFLIRFGKNLFRGCGLGCHEIFTKDMLEEALKAETNFQKSVMKTLDTRIQKNLLEALEEKILEELQTSEFEEKENYFIQVEDNLHPDILLRLICVNNSEDGGQLQLKKIQMEPSACFIADISCVNKLMDLRLTLVSENYSTELSEEETECIVEIVKSACIENGAKGGLHWPLGRRSVGNRFKVHSSWHRKVTTIVGKLWTAKLLHVNRFNFETSFGGVTDEVNLKLTSLTKYLRDQVQLDEENIMNTLEDILKWVWTECL
jgi:hypothetical protein